MKIFQGQFFSIWCKYLLLTKNSNKSHKVSLFWFCNIFSLPKFIFLEFFYGTSINSYKYRSWFNGCRISSNVWNVVFVYKISPSPSFLWIMMSRKPAMTVKKLERNSHFFKYKFLIFWIIAALIPSFIFSSSFLGFFILEPKYVTNFYLYILINL